MTKEEVKNLPIGTKIKITAVLHRLAADYWWVSRDSIDHTAFFVGTVTLSNGWKGSVVNDKYRSKIKYGFVAREYFQAARIKYNKRSKDRFVRFEDMEVCND